MISRWFDRQDGVRVCLYLEDAPKSPEIWWGRWWQIMKWWDTQNSPHIILRLGRALPGPSEVSFLSDSRQQREFQAPRCVSCRCVLKWGDPQIHVIFCHLPDEDLLCQLRMLRATPGPEHIPKRMLDTMPERMSGRMSDRVSEYVLIYIYIYFYIYTYDK